MSRNYLCFLLILLLLIVPAVGQAQQIFSLASSIPLDSMVTNDPPSSVVLIFNGAVGGANVTMSRAGVPINGLSAITAVDQVTFTPAALPLPDGAYTVDFSGVLSVTGGPVAPPTTISFTLDTTGPTLVSSTPSAGQTGVSPDTTITLNFSESIMEENLSFVPLLIGPAEMVTLEVVSAVGTTYTYRPTTQLTRGATYTIDFSAAFDLVGNPAIPPASFSFTVAPPPSPTLVSSSPTAGQQNVALDTNIELRFSKEMNAVASVFALSNGGTIPGTVLPGDDATVLLFVPAAPLAYATTYTVNFSQARDIDGLTPTGTTSFTFQTLPPPALTLTSSLLVDGQQSVPVSTPITLVFSNDVNAAASVITLRSSTELITGSVDAVGQTATFTPSRPMRFATNYTLDFSGVRDTLGQPLTGSSSIAFTTEIGDLAGAVDPSMVSLSANEIVGVSYIIQNRTSQAVTLRSSEAEFLVNGAVISTVSVPAVVTVPANSTVSVPSDVLVSSEIQEAARAAQTDRIVMMRTFQDVQEGTIRVGVPLMVRLTGSLAGPATVTEILVDVPPDSKLIAQFEQIRAHAYIRGTGTGAVVAIWLVDGIPTETFQLNLVAGITQEVWSRMTLPTLDLGEHSVQLQIVRPAPATSNLQRYVVVPGTAGTQRVLLTGPSASTALLPGVTPGVFRWLPMPGASGYEIAFAPDPRLLGLDEDGNILYGPLGHITWTETMVGKGRLMLLSRTSADTLSWRPRDEDYARLAGSKDRILYWAVRAVYSGQRNGDPTTTSRAWRIAALPAPDKLPVQSPADGASIERDLPTFQWAACPGATTYRITLTSYRGETFTALTPHTSYRLPQHALKLLRSGQYVWQVVAAAPEKGVLAAGEKRTICSLLANDAPTTRLAATSAWPSPSSAILIGGLPVLLPGSTDQILISPAHGSTISDQQPKITATYPQAKPDGVLLTLNGVDVTALAVVSSTGATLEPPGVFSPGEHTIGLVVDTVSGERLEAESVFTIASPDTLSPQDPEVAEMAIAPPQQQRPLMLQFDWNWRGADDDLSADALSIDLNLRGEQSWIWRNNSYAALDFQLSRPADEDLELSSFLAHSGFHNDKYKMMMGDVGSAESELTSQGLAHRSFNFITNTGPVKFTALRTLGSKLQRSSIGRAPSLLHLSAETARFASGPGLKLTYMDTENSFTDSTGFGGASGSKILSLRGQTPLGSTGLSLRGEIANSDSQVVSAYGTHGSNGTASTATLDGTLLGFGVAAAYRRVGQDYLSPASMTLTNNLRGWNLNLTRPLGQHVNLVGNYVTLDNVPQPGAPASSSLSRSIDLVASYPNLPSLSLKMGKNTASSAPFVEGGLPSGNEENVLTLTTSYGNTVWNGYLSYSHSDFDDLYDLIDPAVDTPNDRENDTWAYGLSIQPHSTLRVRYDYGSNDVNRWFRPLLATEPLFGTDGSRQSRFQLEYRPFDRLSASLVWAKSEYGDALGTFRSESRDLSMRLNYYLKLSAIGNFVVTGELRRSKWGGTMPGVTKSDFSILLNDNSLFTF